MDGKVYVIVKTGGDYKRYKSVMLDSYGAYFCNDVEIPLKDIAYEIVLSSISNTEFDNISVLNASELSVMIYSILRECENEHKLKFFKDRMITFSLSKEIQNCLRLLRGNDIPIDGDLFGDDEKLEDLYIINECLNEKLDALSKQSGTLFLDESNLYKKAIETINNPSTFIPFKADTFKTFRFNEQSKLEKEFLSALEKLTNKKIDEVCDIKEYEIEEIPNVINKINFTKSYGLHNEIYGVINDIFEKKLQYNDVMVLYPNKDELITATSVLDTLNIPYKTNVNKGAEYSEVYSVIKTVLDIGTFEVSQTRASDKLKGFDAFDRYTASHKNEPIKWFDYLMSIRNAPKENYTKFFNSLKSFITELFDESTYLPFITAIDDVLMLLMDDEKDTVDNLKDFALSILKGVKIPNKQTADDSGFIIMSTLTHLPNEMRKNVYMLGLDSSNFSVKNTESPVLLDDERINCGIENTDYNLKTRASEKEQRRLKETLSIMLLQKYLSLTLSYVFFDSITIKEKTPSSFYMRQKNACHKGDEDIKLIGFFDGIKLKNSNDENDQNKFVSSITVPKYYSATSVDKFIECQKQFYFEKILNINVKDKDEDNEGEWLDATTKGTLVHSILSDFVQKYIIGDLVNNEDLSFNKDKLLKRAEELSTINNDSFNDAMTSLQGITDPLIKEYFAMYPAKPKVFNEMKDSIISAVQKEAKNIIKNIKTQFPIATEWGKIDQAVYIADLPFMKYRIDRIDYDINTNSFVIIDYKTSSVGGILKKKEMRLRDRDDLRQDYIYSYIVDELMNKYSNPLRVSKTIYNFVMQGDNITTSYNADCINKLNETLEQIKIAIKTNTYNRCTDVDSNARACDYCKFKDICKKILKIEKKSDEEGEDE